MIISRSEVKESAFDCSFFLRKWRGIHQTPIKGNIVYRVYGRCCKLLQTQEIAGCKGKYKEQVRREGWK